MTRTFKQLRVPIQLKSTKQKQANASYFKSMNRKNQHIWQWKARFCFGTGATNMTHLSMGSQLSPFD
jgi:hypothetical protein